MLDVEVLRPHFLNNEKFLEILIATNRVRYDWGGSQVWVWSGDDKNPAPGESEWMWGEELHEILCAVGLQHCWPTSAGFVVDLLTCGVNMQIAKDPPFEDGFLDFVRAEAKKLAQNGQAGEVMEFVPKRVDSPD